MFYRQWNFVEKNYQVWQTEDSNSHSIINAIQNYFDIHLDVMTGYENKDKTNERIISSYWWPGMKFTSEVATNV
jgi:hypothetical protein